MKRANRKQILLTLSTCLIAYTLTKAQTPQNHLGLGAWYMYMFSHTFKNPLWGVQGDVQYRNWNIMGDLEQLLIRAGATYRLKNTPLKFTLGYANIISGRYGTSNATSSESRIYQEALYPFKILSRCYFNNRIRLEQRFVEGQSFRTRYRYALFLNVPLNKPELTDKTFYLSFYNELFINGQKHIGEGREIILFDRNRAYAALGYAVRKDLKIQVGIMNQFSVARDKNQLQFSLLHNF